MIDIHTHILPGLDDGAADLNASLAMLEQAAGDGTATLVATPHTLDGTYDVGLNEAAAALEALRGAVARAGLPVSLRLGQEVRCGPALEEALDAGRIACLDLKGRYLLLELPAEHVPAGTETLVFRLRLKGITPILAHPERNATFQWDPDRLAPFVDAGCLAQVTAGSLTGEMGPAALEAAVEMLRTRRVHLIASDAHDCRRRPPRLSHAVGAAGDILKDDALAGRLVTAVPAAVLAGEEVLMPAVRPRGRRGWWFAGR